MPTKKPINRNMGCIEIHTATKQFYIFIDKP